MNCGEIETTRARTFVVNEAFATSRPGVFAAGDAVTGPATIVEAVAQGNLVAVAVDDWIRTGKIDKPQFVTARHDVAAAARPARTTPTPAARRSRGCPSPSASGNFREVETGLRRSRPPRRRPSAACAATWNGWT